MNDIPPFNCVERCQTPDEFFSGGPWLHHPKDGILQLQKGETGLIEWRIWQGNSSEFSIEVDRTPIFVVNLLMLLHTRDVTFMKNIEDEPLKHQNQQFTLN